MKRIYSCIISLIVKNVVATKFENTSYHFHVYFSLFTWVGVFFLLFTVLHAMQTLCGDENSVCHPSVCLSVSLSITQVHADETVKKSVDIYIQYERTFIPVF